MTLTHTGSTKKYSANWENIFGVKKKATNGPKRVAKKRAIAKKKRRR